MPRPENRTWHSDSDQSNGSPPAPSDNPRSRPRPVKSCTHCRQQKTKCDAPIRHPLPCSHCEKLGRKCVVDPYFRPEKGGQVQSLKYDLTLLRNEVEFLKRRESYLASVVAKSNPDSASMLLAESPSGGPAPPVDEVLVTSRLDGNAQINHIAEQINNQQKKRPNSASLSPVLTHSDPLSQLPTKKVRMETTLNIPQTIPQTETRQTDIIASEFVIGDVIINAERAKELHRRFITDYLPFLPIIQSSSADELYGQSHLLFWTVILTASLSEPEPSLYYSLCDKIKTLAIEECWLKTPRSTHVVQALLILGTWPLPNSKVLDDLSFRFVTLAKTIGMQLGLHRGKFLYEFSRSQVSLPDAEKWRTRTWLSIFISEQICGAVLGLPSGFESDYLVEVGRYDESLPARFRSMLKLSYFYAKLISMVGSSLNSPDGLTESRSRCSSLWILNQEYDSLARLLDLADPIVEMYFLYVRLIMCCFAFLPDTPRENQAQYIDVAFQSATRIITLFSTLATKRQIIEYPAYVRQPVSYAALILFRLHISPLLMHEYVESARQSVVTVHRLYRNMLTAWKDLENDISRTAKVLEKLNFVIITHPYLLTHAPQIISRMRSHLSASIFYELVWSIHEARRRSALNLGKPSLMKEETTEKNLESDLPHLVGPYSSEFAHLESVPPLPFYNQITKDDFTVDMVVTPNGTSVTKLVPNHPQAAANALISGPPSPTNEFKATAPPIITENTNLRTISQITEENQFRNPSRNSLLNNPLANVEDISFLDSTGASKDPLHLDALMQGIDWMNGSGDDFLGWLDTGYSPM